MSRTEKRSPFHRWGKESKENRSRLTKQRRRASRIAVHLGDYEKASAKQCGTEGWMTW